MTYSPLVVCYIIALHLVWAFSIYIDPAALNATALAGLLFVFGTPAGVIVALITVSTLAGLSIFSKMPAIVIFLLPQQALLFMSAASSGVAIITSQFADGVVRSQMFLLADQSHVIIISFVHAFAISRLAAQSELYNRSGNHVSK
jgi:hypothetical protein